MGILFLLFAQGLPGLDPDAYAPIAPSGRALEVHARLDNVVVHSGPLTQQEAHRTLAKRRGAFRSCYAAQVNADPTLAGEASLTMDIPADGRGTVRTLERPTEWPQALEDCLERIASQTRFVLPEQAKQPSSLSFDLDFWLQERPPEPRDQ